MGAPGLPGAAGPARKGARGPLCPPWHPLARRGLRVWGSGCGVLPGLLLLLLAAQNPTRAGGAGFASKACRALAWLEGNPSGRVNDACVVLSGVVRLVNLPKNNLESQSLLLLQQRSNYCFVKLLIFLTLHINTAASEFRGRDFKSNPHLTRLLKKMFKLPEFN